MDYNVNLYIQTGFRKSSSGVVWSKLEIYNTDLFICINLTNEYKIIK